MLKKITCQIPGPPELPLSSQAKPRLNFTVPPSTNSCLPLFWRAFLPWLQKKYPFFGSMGRTVYLHT